MSERQIKAGKLQNLKKLALSHSLTLDMLNNFCFHLYAQKWLFIAENCNAFFLPPPPPVSLEFLELVPTEIPKLLDFCSNPGLTSRVSELEIGSNNCPSGAFRSDPLETWSDNTKTRVLLELFPKFQGQASEYFDWLYSIPLPTIILKQPYYL